MKTQQMRVRSGQAHWIHQVSSRKHKNILAYSDQENTYKEPH